MQFQPSRVKKIALFFQIILYPYLPFIKHLFSSLPFFVNLVV